MINKNRSKQHHCQLSIDPKMKRVMVAVTGFTKALISLSLIVSYY